MSRVAVIGAGFAGLALSYHLLLQGFRVYLFDAKGIGGGASGIAAGLLHPYKVSGKLKWRGEQAMAEAEYLLQISERALGRDVRDRGILRLALDDQGAARLKKNMKSTMCGAHWWEKATCSSRLQKGFVAQSGLFMRFGQTVHAKLYLEGLWRACRDLGACFEKREVDLSLMSHFDQVAIAAGGDIKKFEPCRLLNIEQNKGQILLCKKPLYFTLELSVMGKGYVAMSNDTNCFYLGSTYERNYLDESPCLERAKRTIFEKVEQFFPLCKSLEVLRCSAGVRVDRQRAALPLCGKLQPRLWVVTALGSRGLLYHGLVGRFLSMAILQNDAALIPKEFCL